MSSRPPPSGSKVVGLHGRHRCDITKPCHLLLDSSCLDEGLTKLCKHGATVLCDPRIVEL